MTPAFRVLLVGQTDAKENGIYNPQAGPWTRTVDADLASEVGGAVVDVARGNRWQGTTWQTTFRSFADSFAATNQWWYQLLNSSNGLIPTVDYCTTPANGNINLATGGLLTIDGRVTVAGDRVLVTNQTLPAENGIYIASAGAWVRSSEARTAVALAGAMVTIAKGVTLSGTQWATAFFGTATIDTTPMIWGQIMRSDRAPLGTGTAALPTLYFASDTNTGIFTDPAVPDMIGFSTNGTENMRLVGNVSYKGVASWPIPGMSANTFLGGALVGCNQAHWRFSADALGPSIQLGKTRGTFAAPIINNSNDTLGGIIFYGYDGATFNIAGRLNGQADGAPVASSGNSPGRLAFLTTTAAGVETERMRVTSGGDVGIGKTPSVGVMLDVAGPVRMGSYTLATIPAATLGAGLMAYVTNATPGAVLAVSNGTLWKLAGTQTTLA